MWIIFSFYWICYNIASVFMLWFFCPKACWILAPWPGIEPTPPALEGEVSTTEPPGKSPYQELSTWSVPPHLQAVHENPETLGKIGFFWAWSFGVFKNSHVGPELRCILIHLPMQEKWVWSLSWEDSLEEEMATHSSAPGFLPGKFHGHRSLVGYRAWGHKKSDTTEWLSTHNALIRRVTCLKSVAPAQVFLPLVGSIPHCPLSPAPGVSIRDAPGPARSLLKCTAREAKETPGWALF